VHWDIGADGLAKPHAHVMLTMREVNADGFGAKVRDWNRTELIDTWRERWAYHVNERLASLDIDARIDHRSLADQGIDLEPQNKIGPAASRMGIGGLEAERIAEHAEIARRNGERIIADPGIALDAITHNQATFTKRDLAMFVHRRSEGKVQFDQAMSAVQSSPDLVALGQDGKGEDRFTSKAMIEVEARLERTTDIMAARNLHSVSDRDRERALSSAEARGLVLSGEQRDAFDHATNGKDLGVVIGYAGTGKSAMLGVAREAWEDAGYKVRGAALSGIAAENLEAGSGIASRTIAGLEHGWAQGRDLLTANDVLVIDEAGMVGSRQVERVLSAAEKAGAKVVLVGDPQQLQAIEAGAAFRSLAERHGGVEITEIRRQQVDWQRDATRHLATGAPVRLSVPMPTVTWCMVPTREKARARIWSRGGSARLDCPGQSQIILTHTNDEVRALNELAREKLHDAGALGGDATIKTERGERQFATGDRLMFLRNDRELGVKNGTLGTVSEINSQRIAVRVDDGRSIAFDTKDYAHIDHGYAATIHKAQGVTVDRTHVLATPGMDRHSAYVALSRHRDGLALHYGKDDFADQSKLVRALSRERAKDMASDYQHAPDAARDFANRREIRLPAMRLPEPAQRDIASQPVRSIFASFRPSPAAPEVAIPSARGENSGLGRAVERYARATADLMRMRDQGVPAMPHQLTAREAASEKLDAVRPYTARDLANALQRQPELVSQAASGNTAATIRAMALEAEVRTNPALRADRFVETWQRFDRIRDRAIRTDDRPRIKAVTANMSAMAKSLERDPQIDSLLRNRKIELGLRTVHDGGIAHQLHEHLGLGLARGLGIGM
jgi:Ti-type conjugative transfer relaxase TraA